MVEKIDFVVAWVDGNDPVWRKRKHSTMEQLIPLRKA